MNVPALPKIKDLPRLWQIVEHVWLPAAVRYFEVLLGPGTGAEKKARVIDTVLALVKQACPDGLEWFVLPCFAIALDWAVDSLVEELNRRGVFPKPTADEASEPAPTPEPAPPEPAWLAAQRRPSP